MMDAIIREAESSALRSAPSPRVARDAGEGDLVAVVHAAREAAADAGAKAVAVYTQTGSTARHLSKLRPPCPILALTFRGSVARRMTLYWGVTPVRIRFAADTDTMIAAGDREMLRAGLVERGDRVVVVAGTTPYPGGTNMMKIHRVGHHPRGRR
jgi:pyruvate kinase